MKTIYYNLINTGLAGFLVFLGACADGNITLRGVTLAFIAGLIVFITKFKHYWEKNEKEITKHLFNFL
jgi:hypothetical protein